MSVQLSFSFNMANKCRIEKTIIIIIIEQQLYNRISKPSATNLFGIHRTFHNSTSFSDVCIKYLCIDREELFTKVITVDKEKVELD